MNLWKRLANELVILLLFPTSLVMMMLITQAWVYEMLMFWVLAATAFLTYVVIRWAFFEKSGNLGISNFEYWIKRKESWTHGSK